MIVKAFKGEYSFLSNYFDSPMVVDGEFYPTAEHFFQASKAKDDWDHELIRRASTPGEAKRLGRNVNLKEDWEKIKDAVMYKGVKEKFIQNPDFAKKLLSTKDAILQEGNTWRDTYWGMDLESGAGRNKLGEILMQVRKELSEEKKQS
jgi:ribA/ribD-fused uncharacterized protein